MDKFNIVESFDSDGLNVSNSSDNNKKDNKIAYQSHSNRDSGVLIPEAFNLNLLETTNIGPNVNIKFPKNINRSSEQKEFFKRKITKTKKTELCKNWEIFGDCFYKDKCSFAHGENELRNKLLAKNEDNEKYKTKPCRSFMEKGYCPFGNRCQYTHIVSHNRLLSYKAINLKMANGILTEAMKSDNDQFDFIRLLDNASINSPIKM